MHLVSILGDGEDIDSFVMPQGMFPLYRFFRKFVWTVVARHLLTGRDLLDMAFLDEIISDSKNF